MTVAVQALPITYNGNGTASPLAVPFRFLANDHLVVTHIAASGARTVLVRGTHYSVAGAGAGSGGTVTPLAAIATGDKWEIDRATPREQPTAYPTGDDFPAETHELALDRNMLVAQEQDARATALAARTPLALPGQNAPSFDVAGLGEGDLLEFSNGKLRRFDAAPFAAKFFAGAAGTGRPVPSSGLGGGDLALRSDLADAEAGAALVNTPYGNLAAYLPELRSKRVSLKRFEVSGQTIGAGNAEHDDAAFAAAIAALMDSRRIETTADGFVYPSMSIYIPPGNYKTEGGFGADLELIGLVADYNTVTIKNIADTYFIECPNRLDTTYIDGLVIVGGKGVLNHTYTGNNVSWTHTIKNTIAIGYTGTAWAFEAADMPYLRFHNNLTRCKYASGTVTKGLSKRGLIDNDSYRDNAFECSNIHLQLGPLASSNVEIMNNAFLSFEADRTDYDIWFVPNDNVGAFGINSGGIKVDGNKFGNEGRTTIGSVSRPRILVAAKNGSIASTATPSLTWKSGSDGANFFSGLSFNGNWIYNASPSADFDGYSAPFIANYINQFAGMYWGPDNLIAGGRFDYLVQHMDGGARQTSYANTTSIIELGGAAMQFAYGSSFRYGVSNKSMGFVKDSLGMDNSPLAILPSRDPDEFILKADALGTAWGFEAGITTTNVADYRGIAGAARKCVWTVAGRRAYIQFLESFTGRQERMGWVLQQYWADEDPVDQIDVLIENSVTGARAAQFSVPVTIERRVFCAPFFLPTSASPANWQITVSAPKFVTGSKDVCILGATLIIAGRHAPSLGRYPPIAAPTGGATVDAEARAVITNLLAMAADQGHLL